MPPRAVVVGAGSLGTLYGAALARAGARVQLLARRPHAEAIARNGGVTVASLNGAWHAPLGADWRPERIEPAEIAIVMTKSHDTAPALASLAHLTDRLEVAVSFQNGIVKDMLLCDWCGEERVIGGISMVGATLEGPGAVSHTLAGPTYTGELPTGTSERVDRLAALLNAGGLPTIVSAQILAAEWSKLAHAGPSMTITTLSGLPFDQALRDARLADLYVRLLREAAAVAGAGAEPVGLLDLPGTFPVRTFVDAEHDAAVEMVRERGRQITSTGATNVVISMLKDLRDGRRLELEAIHQYVVDEARRRDVSVPLSIETLAELRRLDPGTGPQRPSPTPPPRPPAPRR